MRAFIKLAAKNPRAAIEDATRATGIDVYDSESYVALAMAYNSIKDFENAAKAARKALEIRPDSWQARLETAKSLYGLSQFEAALQELDAVPVDFPDVHLVRGNILMGLGRRPDAVQEFRAFLQEDPHDARGPQIRSIMATTSLTPTTGSGANAR